MIDGLIAGKVHGQPTERTAKTGKPFAIATVRAAVDGGDAIFVRVIAFEPGACAALLALSDGDAVSLAGTLTPKAYTGKDGTIRPALDMVAHRVLTAYHVSRRRKAVQVAEPADDGLLL